MKTKLRLLLPAFLIFLIIVGACAGGWMWYDSHVDRSGWAEQDGVRYYQDFYGDPVSGWLDLDDGRYYFQEGGIPALHWQEIDGITYYFGDNGIMHTGWLQKDLCRPPPLRSDLERAFCRPHSPDRAVRVGLYPSAGHDPAQKNIH